MTGSPRWWRVSPPSRATWRRAIEQQAQVVEQIARSSAGEADAVNEIVNAIADLERQARTFS
ncbi:MAG: hypothetical protein R2755_15815 [Acidimicrobiales bacterium]